MASSILAPPINSIVFDKAITKPSFCSLAGKIDVYKSKHASRTKLRQADKKATQERKEIRRREQCRANQARYRNRQRTRQLQLEQCVQQLQEEIDRLKQGIECSQAGGRPKWSPWSVVAEVSRLLDENFFSPWRMVHGADMENYATFRQDYVSSSEAVGDFPRLEGLVHQVWHWSSHFGDPKLQLERIESTASDVITAAATLSVTVTELTLRNAFLNLSQPTDRGSHDTFSAVGVQLLGQRLHLSCLMKLLLDEETGRIVRLENTVDFVDSLLRMLDNPEDVTIALHGPGITVAVYALSYPSAPSLTNRQQFTVRGRSSDVEQMSAHGQAVVIDSPGKLFCGSLGQNAEVEVGRSAAQREPVQLIPDVICLRAMCSPHLMWFALEGHRLVIVPYCRPTLRRLHEARKGISPTTEFALAMAGLLGAPAFSFSENVLPRLHLGERQATCSLRRTSFPMILATRMTNAPMKTALPPNTARYGNTNVVNNAVSSRTPTSRSNAGEVTGKKGAPKYLNSAIRRQQCRVNQARYRNKQREAQVQLEKNVEQLHQEVNNLKRRYRDLSSRERSSQSPWSIVAEVFHLLENCFRSPWRMTSTKEMMSHPQTRLILTVLERAFAHDVAMGDLRGVDALMEQLRQYSQCFGDPHLQLKCIESVSAGVMAAQVELSVTVTELTLKHIFPHLMNDANSDTKEQGKMLCDRLLGKRLQLSCTMNFLFDDLTCRVVRLEACIDFATALFRVFGDLEDVSLALEHARITSECTIDA
ncbi:hypothetical protein ON010_g13657 [Phytophthora cinnamomi]|nr:hypothetical protein ON010_g13657 [Phytophthora cinnamomi]